MPMRPTALHLFGLALAGGCIALSLPVAQQAWVRLPGDPLRDSVIRFQPLSPAQQTLFVESRRPGAASDHRDLGRMHLAGVDDGPDARQRLSRAITDLETALAAAPADGFAWADLSLARLRRDGASPASLAALRLSIAMAPAEPALVVWRIAMLLDHELLFQPGDEGLLSSQLRTAWAYQPQPLLRLLQSRQRVASLRQALDNAPAELERLEKLLAPRG